MEKHIVTPGAVVPARELLGEMLLEVDCYKRLAALSLSTNATRPLLREAATFVVDH